MSSKSKLFYTIQKYTILANYLNCVQPQTAVTSMHKFRAGYKNPLICMCLNRYNNVRTVKAINVIFSCMVLVAEMRLVLVAEMRLALVAEMKLVQVAKMRLVLVAKMRLVLVAEIRLVLMAEMRLVLVAKMRW